VKKLFVSFALLSTVFCGGAALANENPIFGIYKSGTTTLQQLANGGYPNNFGYLRIPYTVFFGDCPGKQSGTATVRFAHTGHQPTEGLKVEIDNQSANGDKTRKYDDLMFGSREFRVSLAQHEGLFDNTLPLKDGENILTAFIKGKNKYRSEPFQFKVFVEPVVSEVRRDYRIKDVPYCVTTGRLNQISGCEEPGVASVKYCPNDSSNKMEIITGYYSKSN
jgi:hypothetical protein